MRNYGNIGQWPMGLVCDTPVPYYEVGVSCGLPSEMGQLPPEMIMLPSMLTRGRSVFIVDADGDSMTGVGIYSGDQILIEGTQRVNSGEVVMASIDGEELLKVYYVDDCGRHWLLPANDKYQPRELTADMNVRICGRMVCNLSAPHVSVKHCGEVVRQFKAKQKQHQPDMYERLTEAVIQCSHLFWAASAWAVVFGVLRDCCGKPGNMQEFERSAMRLQLPAGFKHPCSIGTVQRTISNHRYMEKHIDNWAANGALNRELKLMEQLRMLLQD